jgi:hypothetical protein
MKSAYELAMERLNQQSPSIQLSDEQKKQLAELDSRYAARVAEREIALRDAIAKATATGEMGEAEELEQQLALDKKKLHTELEEKKDEVRKNG